MAGQYIRPSYRDQFLTNVYTFVLAEEVPVTRGSLLQAVDRLPKDFAVIDNRFGYNRSRGILVKGANGKITGNIIEETWDYAIEVAPEYYWLEGSSSNNLLIANNRITNARSISIVVSAFGGKSWVSAPEGVHRNITIEDNSIGGGPAPGVIVTSTENLRFVNNTIDLTKERKALPYVLARFPFLEEGQAVALSNTSGIFENNRIAVDGVTVDVES